ncbi:MAG: hypothetical protein PVH62_07930 [Anaerolineae bacterium]|jgi:hypothetical protein
MRRSTLLWGTALILVGVLLLVDSLGLLGDVGVWNLIWPLGLIAVGLWVLWTAIGVRRPIDAEEATIPLKGAARAHVRIRHGAGRLRVEGVAGPGELAKGTFGGGLEYHAKQEGELLDVEMYTPRQVFWRFLTPWNWREGSGLDWTLSLNGEVPLSLDLEIGAGDARLDLRDLQVTELRASSGASSTHLTLPAHAGHTYAEVKAGAASVAIRVPSGVAARIRVGGGLASIGVDRDRFPRVGSFYQSPDYDTAPNKVDVDIEAGVGSIKVR